MFFVFLLLCLPFSIIALFAMRDEYRICPNCGASTLLSVAAAQYPLMIIAIVIVLLIVGVVGAGVFWWMRNKDALLARAKEVVTEAKDFGNHSDNQGCVDESISRYKRDPGFSSAISNSIFMRTCLDASKPTPGFCAEVPRQTEFIKTAQWRIDQCRRVDLASDNNCQNLFTPIQQFCEAKH